MNRPNCMCCKHWGHCYENATCDKCQSGEPKWQAWQAKDVCTKPDKSLRCDTCRNNPTTEASGQPRFLFECPKCGATAFFKQAQDRVTCPKCARTFTVTNRLALDAFAAALGKKDPK